MSKIAIRASAGVMAIAAISLPKAGSAFVVISDCGAGDAPSSHSGYDCNAICTVDLDGGAFGSDAVVCDGDLGGTSHLNQGAEITAVFDYAGESFANYSAWGEDSLGGGFCCFVADSDDEVGKFELQGVPDEADVLAFQYGSYTMNSPVPDTWFEAAMHSYSGDDYLLGSTEDYSSFYDLIYAGTGDDEIWSGAGGDLVCAGQGNDEIHAQEGNDIVDAGPGADLLYAGYGNDVLCGGGSGAVTADTFYASNGNNTLWQAYALFTATPVGTVGGTSSHCGHTTWGSSWAGSCTYDLSSAPSACGSC